MFMASSQLGSLPGGVCSGNAERGHPRTQPDGAVAPAFPRSATCALLPLGPGTVSSGSWMSHPGLSGLPGAMWPGQRRQPCVPAGLEQDAGSGAAPHKVTR